MLRVPRPLVLGFAALATVLMCLPASAQAQGRRGGGARGFGGRMGGFGRMGGGLNLLGVATNEEAQKRLKLSETQVKAVAKVAEESRAARGQGARRGFPEGFRDMTQEERDKALAKMREEAEARRKKTEKALEGAVGDKYPELVKLAAGVALQSGPTALQNAEVAAAVGVSKESQAKVAKIVEASREKTMAMFKEMRGGNFDRTAMQEKMAEARKQLNGQIAGAITSEEKAKVQAAVKAAEGIQLRRGRGMRGGRQGAGRGGRGGAPGGPPGGQ